MATVCDLCGKGKLFTKMGRHHRGVAGGRWKHQAQKTRKILKPNLHPFNGFLNGKKGKWWLCTKCLRKVKGKTPSKPKESSSEEITQK
ncbi:MAG: L28 family ribosomal protein [Microgenomates group bacterium]